MMKNPLVQKVSKWMFKAYIAWSICADIIVIGGILYLKMCFILTKKNANSKKLIAYLNWGF